MLSVSRSKPEYLYIIQEREFWNQKRHIYKIGRTSESIDQRMKGYPKNSRLIYCREVFDSRTTENRIIEILKNVTTQRTDIGKEYFEGNINVILIKVGEICNEIECEFRKEFGIELNIDESQPPSSKKVKIENSLEETKQDPDEEYEEDSDQNVVKMYECHRCHEIFEDRNKLILHWKRRIIPCDFVCDTCGVKMHSKRAYQQHAKRGEECIFIPSEKCLKKGFRNNIVYKSNNPNL